MNATTTLERVRSISGEVMRGKQLGRTIGFPTANLSLPADVALDGGVYAAWVRRADGTIHAGAASVGVRPTATKDGERLLEVHLLDTDRWLDLYGEVLTVYLVKPLRLEQRFASLDELSAQIGRDCDRARTVLAGLPPPLSS